MNFFDFYAMHPVGYSILLIIILNIICDCIARCFKD